MSMEEADNLFNYGFKKLDYRIQPVKQTVLLEYRIMSDDISEAYTTAMSLNQ